MKTKNLFFLVLFFSITNLLGGCATTRINTSTSIAMDKAGSWGILPFDNHTTVPFAGQRAQKLAAALLQSRGIANIHFPPSSPNPMPIGQSANNPQQYVAWAKENNIRYLISGSVDEWRYKVGLDGEPAVSFTLELRDVSSDASLWRGAASASGRYWQSAGVLAQSTLDRLIKRLLSE